MASLDPEKILRFHALEPFNADGVRFLDALSKALNKDPQIRHFPDVATFAFFCRKANILKLKEQYEKEEPQTGSGYCFSHCPIECSCEFCLFPGVQHTFRKFQYREDSFKTFRTG